MSVISREIVGLERRLMRRGPGGDPGRVGRTPVDGRQHFRADLHGFHEVPPVLTPGTGRFRASVSAEGSAIQYELVYANLTAPATVAHIHFGQPGVNGEIFVFLCGGDAPTCPGEGGRVAGTITAENILAVPEQGIAEGDLAGALRIIRAGVAYVNVHTPTFPAGEIRGQIRRG